MPHRANVGAVREPPDPDEVEKQLKLAIDDTEEALKMLRDGGPNHNILESLYKAAAHLERAIDLLSDGEAPF